MKLFKTTVVIWTDENPEDWELEDLARQATHGDAICTSQVTVPVDDLTHDEEGRTHVHKITEFFNFEGGIDLPADGVDDKQAWYREQAKKRPSNFEKLPAAEQWEIDKQLGILDWEE